MKNKVIVLALVLAMVLGTVGTSFGAVFTTDDFNPRSYDAGSNVVNAQLEEGLSENDEIKVIVELRDEPIIEYATRRGVAVDELEDSLFEALEDTLTREQDRVLEEIRYSNLDIDVERRFTTVINGFSGSISVRDAKEMANIPGVERITVVSRWERPVIQMDTSKDIVKAIETWGLGYRGEGMVVSIIDTGVDYTHQDMNLTNPSKGKLTETKVNSLGLKGKFYSDKVPYGYNYADKSFEIRDLGTNASMHGMHVAGTVAANGKLTGVAPEAQLLAMKVFGNDPANPYVYGDNLVASIEDSVKLGADVMNLSLGGIAGFSNDDDLQQAAINRAVENGVVMAIAAGNDFHFGGSPDRGGRLPWAINPDTSVVGTPSVARDSFSIASYENTHMPATALYTKAGNLPYMLSGNIDPVNLFSGREVSYLHGGLGNSMEEFEGQDFNGKIALVQRGVESFSLKVENAEKAGAIGVIIFNSEAGGDALMGMDFGEFKPSVPVVFMGITDGLRLVGLIEEGKNQISFNGEEVSAPNPSAYTMSGFSSWGIAPDLSFKPELSAPGGQIYSTLNDDSYGMMSGTSMATPHVAGGSALILERVSKDFPRLEGKDRVEMVKKLMMSTANPVYEDFYGGNYDTTSPRKQGSGVMNLLGASTTPAIITSVKNGETKVELKEVGDITRFELEVTNFSNKALQYNVYPNITTDLAISGEFWMKPQPIFDSVTGQLPIKVLGLNDDILTVPANGSASFEIEIDLTNAVDWGYWAPLHDIFPNGCFVDGFVQLVDPTETNPNLSIPYIGFYGDWTKASIFDVDKYSEGYSFFGSTGLASLKDGFYLGYTPEGDIDGKLNAISPNGDGVFDSVNGLITFLRNAKEVEINILDKDYRVVRRLATDWDVRKNGFSNGTNNGVTYRTGWNNDWEWDGTVYGDVIEGQYYYQVRAKIDYEGADWQEINMPVKVDVTPPVIKDLSFENGVVRVNATDESTPIYKYSIVDNRGQIVYETLDSTIDLAGIENRYAGLSIRVYDYARNYAEKEIFAIEDTEAPNIVLETPGAYNFFNDSEVEFSGYVEDVSALRYLKVNGERANISYNSATGVYDFSGVVKLPDGINVLRIEGEDIKGNFIEFERKIYVDTEDPTVRVIDADFPRVVENNVDRVRVKLMAADNSYGFKVLVHGNEVFNNFNSNSSYYNEFLPTSEVIDVEVEIREGENIIKVIVIDYFDNEVEIEIGRVYRKMY